MKPHHERKPVHQIDDDSGFDESEDDTLAWYQRDQRTRRLAALIGGGYGCVSVEIVYAARDQPGETRLMTWVGFDVQPQFPHFRDWLNAWEERERAQVLDLRATVTDLVIEQEIALNPHILFVH